MSSVIYEQNRVAMSDGNAGPMSGTPKRAQLVAIETPNGDTAMDEVNDAVRVNVVAGGGGGGGGTSMTDDSAFTAGTTAVTPAAGFYDSGRDAVDDGDAGALAMTSVRGLLVSVETPTGDSAMDDVNDALRVNIVAGAGSGGTAMADESAFTAGTTTFTPIGGVYEEAITTPADGEGAAARITENRALHTNLRNASGTELGVLASPLRVDPTGTTNQPVVGTKTNDAAVPGATNLGVLPGVATTAAPTYNDTRQVALSLDLAGNTRVIAGSNSGVDIGDVTINNAGGGAAVNIQDGGNTITVDGTVTANAGTGTFTVGGVAAHDAAVSGNPVLVGAEGRDTAGTAVTSGDAVRIQADRYGRLKHTKPVVTQASSNGTPITTATNTTAVSAPSAGNHIRVWRLHATNAGSTATYVYWRSSTTGTLRYPAYLPQGGIMSIPIDGQWDLTTAEALVINTTATGSVEWHVDYEVVTD